MAHSLRTLISSSSVAMKMTSLDRIFSDYYDSGDDSNQWKKNQQEYVEDHWPS
jgi:hypothetical protein